MWKMRQRNEGIELHQASHFLRVRSLLDISICIQTTGEEVINVGKRDRKRSADMRKFHNEERRQIQAISRPPTPTEKLRLVLPDPNVFALPRLSSHSSAENSSYVGEFRNLSSILAMTGELLAKCNALASSSSA